VSSPRKKQEFEHSFKRFKRPDPRREIEEDEDWKKNVEEEIDDYLNNDTGGESP
jgi:hypothetical protein